MSDSERDKETGEPEEGASQRTGGAKAARARATRDLRRAILAGDAPAIREVLSRPVRPYFGKTAGVPVGLPGNLLELACTCQYSVWVARQLVDAGFLTTRRSYGGLLSAIVTLYQPRPHMGLQGISGELAAEFLHILARGSRGRAHPPLENLQMWDFVTDLRRCPERDLLYVFLDLLPGLVQWPPSARAMNELHLMMEYACLQGDRRMIMALSRLGVSLAVNYQPDLPGPSGRAIHIANILSLGGRQPVCGFRLRLADYALSLPEFRGEKAMTIAQIQERCRFVVYSRGLFGDSAMLRLFLNYLRDTGQTLPSIEIRPGFHGGWASLLGAAVDTSCHDVTRYVGLIRSLLAAGCDPNVCGPFGDEYRRLAAIFPALGKIVDRHWCRGKDEAARLLIGAGARVQIVEHPWIDPLCRALSFCRFRFVRLLLEHGANLHAVYKNVLFGLRADEDATPVGLDRRGQDGPSCTVWFACEANPNEFGYESRLAIAKFLVDNGVSPNHDFDVGLETESILARSIRYAKDSWGDDPDDEEGDRAGPGVINPHNNKLFHFLMDHGARADVAFKRSATRSLLDYALACGVSNMVIERLLAHGADPFRTTNRLARANQAVMRARERVTLLLAVPPLMRRNLLQRDPASNEDPDPTESNERLYDFRLLRMVGRYAPLRDVRAKVLSIPSAVYEYPAVQRSYLRRPRRLASHEREAARLRKFYGIPLVRAREEGGEGRPGKRQRMGSGPTSSSSVPVPPPFSSSSSSSSSAPALAAAAGSLSGRVTGIVVTTAAAAAAAAAEQGRPSTPPQEEEAGDSGRSEQGEAIRPHPDEYFLVTEARKNIGRDEEAVRYDRQIRAERAEQFRRRRAEEAKTDEEWARESAEMGRRLVGDDDTQGDDEKDHETIPEDEEITTRYLSPYLQRAALVRGTARVRPAPRVDISDDEEFDSRSEEEPDGDEDGEDA